MNISVVICSHNPREDYLRRTLEALKGQSLPTDQWELLLIDNASEQPLARQWDLSWHPHARIVREEKVGLTFARLRGIAESQAEILVFVDDDNVLEPSYLEEAGAIAEKYPVLGCFGAGRIEPEFEVVPPADALEVSDMLALRTSEEDAWSNRPDDNSVPWGAGLVVRREVAEQHRRHLESRTKGRTLGRQGTHLSSCEDNDFSWTCCKMGLGKGIFVRLRLTHLIDKKRMSPAYLCKIAEGHGFSYTMLAAIHQMPVRRPEPLPTVWTILKTLVQLQVVRGLGEARRWNTFRRHTQLKQDVRRAWNRGIIRAVEMLERGE
jgi:glycosyltransferase involved in cell wall biosynthesis